MNKPIRAVSIFCMLLFLALMVNVTYLQFWKADSLNDDPRNRRVIEAAYSRDRGAILVGRTEIAESVPVDDEYEYQRRYPEPFQYAAVTGYFSFYSQTGIEQTQNQVLAGDDPRLFVTKLVDLISNESNQGGSVQLTLDADAQQAAFDGLSGLPGDVQGSVVALEPSSGKILAMVSLPTYDPNKLADHDLEASADIYERLNTTDSEPLLNRAIQKTLPPGSTFKLVTAAAAIESGQYDADSEVPGGPTYQLPLTSGESGLIDNEGRDCGTDKIPFKQAMAQSCNTTFAALANEVGADAMLEQAEKFGFNQHYLDDLRPQAESVFPTEMDEAETGQSGFGQFEVRSTPLQMAMVTAGIANDGKVMKPYLVDEVQSAEYDTLEKTDDEEFSQAVSSSTASDLTDLLVATVDEGTASPVAITGVTVAGKTGTAQSGTDDPPYAWFVAFAPAENPEVAVAVMIEQADIPRGEIAGGQLGGPIAKAVIEAVIR
jgi:peptidoglycan glycosyltransferase